MKRRVIKVQSNEPYKGHRPGSRIGRLHQVFDQRGKKAAKQYGRRLDLSPRTISTQIYHFSNT